MSAVETAVPSRGTQGEGFSARTVLALILVGVVAFAGLGVLSAYAPDLRGSADPGAHALSSSAVGFKGAVTMLQAEGVPAVVNRNPPRGGPSASLVMLTPSEETHADDLKPYGGESNQLIVLPKWLTAPRPLQLGYVDKVGASLSSDAATALLSAHAPRTDLLLRRGVSKPVLHGAGPPFDEPQQTFRLGTIDRLQTIEGDGWAPILTDEQGRMVLARSIKHPGLVVLADPDLLNNQGVYQIDNARAGLAILNALRGEHGVTFDVTLNGFSRGRGIGRTMLEPPWLAATLCGVATAILLGFHALARFGPVQSRDRALALGKQALVDNSAGLVRMARREAELAPAYAALTKAEIGRLAGGGGRAAQGHDNDLWLGELARLRGAASPEEMTAAAERAASRDDLLEVGRKLFAWKSEMTRERR